MLVDATSVTEFHRHTLPHHPCCRPRIAGPPSTSTRGQDPGTARMHRIRAWWIFDNEGGLTVGLVGTQDPGIVPGQFLAALYDGAKECLGGGVME